MEIALISETELKEKGLDHVLGLLKRGIKVFISPEGSYHSYLVAKMLYTKEVMGLSWKELAEAFKTTERYLKDIKEGKRFPNGILPEKIEELYSIAELMDSVLSPEAVRMYLRKKDKELGDVPIEMIKRGEWEPIHKAFIDIAYNIPL